MNFLNRNQWTGRDGTEITFRPIRPKDEQLLLVFHQSLSVHSVFQRYFMHFQLAQRAAHSRLKKICSANFDNAITLIAEQIGSTSLNRVLGVGGLVITKERAEAEFSLLVADSYQGRGLGNELLRRLVEMAKVIGVTRINGYILPENRIMQHVARKQGFLVEYCPKEHQVRALYELPNRHHKKVSNSLIGGLRFIGYPPPLSQ